MRRCPGTVCSSVCPSVRLPGLSTLCSPALWSMWNVWSAQKCQRLRVNPKGWELDTARGRAGERERGNTHTCTQLAQKSLKTKPTSRGGATQAVVSLVGDVRRCFLFGSLSCRRRCCCCCAAHSRVSRAPPTFRIVCVSLSHWVSLDGALEWNSRTHRRGVWLWFARDVFYALSARNCSQVLR